ncbi:MAG: Tungstate transporter substrate-binding protein WtpA [Thermoproteota archaeon]|nr:Tungstate transporter substrate-binding protein WtpA [Thermoproteota archaeon]
MKKLYIILAVIVVVLGSSLTLFFQSLNSESKNEKTTITVFCADSLMFSLQRIIDSFESQTPSIKVEMEGHGSIQVIRHVTELGYKVDLCMVADYSLIPIMMYNTTIPTTNQSFANWYIRFAGNRIVLAYTNHSKYADQINSSNWYKILAKSDVTFGFPNPMIDALGYRVLITIQLAEDYYNDNQIFDRLIYDNFNPHFSSIQINSKYIVTVPEVQTPVGDKVRLRSSGIQLIPLLESGSIDYSFLYLSQAKQQGFSFVELPPELNLESPQYQEVYSKIRVRFEQQRFASISLDQDGKAIYYGLTIPKNAPQREAATKFVEFILSEKGQEIFNSTWFPIFQPSLTDNINNIPEILHQFTSVEH